MLSNCVATELSRTDYCFPQSLTTEITNHQPLESVTTDYREIAKNPKQAMLYWLIIALGLTSDEISTNKIYHLYKRRFIYKTKNKTPEEQHQDFLTLEKIATKNEDIFKMYARTAKFTTKFSVKYLSIQQCKEDISSDELCKPRWWYIYPEATQHKRHSINSRISISVTPEGYEPLMNLLASIMHPSHKLHEYIINSKICNTIFTGSLVDAAILYLNNDELDEEILQNFKEAIAPLEKFALNIPFGMQPLTSCSAYGEHQKPVKTRSFGRSRTEVINDAIKSCRSSKKNGIAFSLEQELEKACIHHGLDPENPAFVINNKHMFINAIPHYIGNASFQG
jgi:hypothetical protein